MNIISTDPASAQGPVKSLPDEHIECPKHGTYTAKVKIYSFLSGRKIYTQCPVCEKEEAEAARKKADQRETRRRDALYQTMNIGARYWDASFDTFNAYTPELQRHIKTARFFADKPDGTAVMLGENGNGKTHLAVSVLKRAGGVICKAYEIGLLTRRAYEGTGSEWDVLERLCAAPLL